MVTSRLPVKREGVERMLLCKWERVKAFSSCIYKNNCFMKPWLICYKLNITNPLCRYKGAVCSVCYISEYMNIKYTAFLLLKEGPRVCLHTRMSVLSVGLRPTASTSPGNVLKMLILRLYLRSTELNTPGAGLSCLCFNKPSRGFWWLLKCEKAVQENSCFLDVWSFLTTLKGNWIVWAFCSWVLLLFIKILLWNKGEEP